MSLTTVQPGMLGTPQPYNFKNRIINGAMTIDQRNAGASVTLGAVNPQYTLDRWCFQTSQASKISTQQNAGLVTPPVGFTNYLGVTSLSSYSITSSDFFDVQQRIEGYNFADLGWGTADAKTVTLSFWVRSSLTGTFGGALCDSVFGRSYPFSYSIPVANTWTQISITIAGSTSGTWNTTNGNAIYVVFGLGCGSTYAGTAGAWVNSGVLTCTGATSVVGTNGATFYLTGVQLEQGVTATTFDIRPYSTELMLCQRYYIRYTLTSSFPFVGRTLSDNRVQLNLPLRYQMRTTPSLVSSDITAVNNIYFGTSRVSPNGTQTYSLSGHESVDIGGILISGGGTYTDGQIAVAQITGSIAYSAEL